MADIIDLYKQPFCNNCDHHQSYCALVLWDTHQHAETIKSLATTCTKCNKTMSQFTPAAVDIFIQQLRETIYNSDNWTCIYCNQLLSYEVFHQSPHPSLTFNDRYETIDELCKHCNRRGMCKPKSTIPTLPPAIDVTNFIVNPEIINEIIARYTTTFCAICDQMSSNRYNVIHQHPAHSRVDMYIFDTVCPTHQQRMKFHQSSEIAYLRNHMQTCVEAYTPNATFCLRCDQLRAYEFNLISRINHKCFSEYYAIQFDKQCKCNASVYKYTTRALNYLHRQRALIAPNITVEQVEQLFKKSNTMVDWSDLTGITITRLVEYANYVYKHLNTRRYAVVEQSKPNSYVQYCSSLDVKGTPGVNFTPSLKFSRAWNYSFVAAITEM